MIIDGINFETLEAEKYWSFAKSYKGDPKLETQQMIYSGDYLGARKMDGAYYRFIKDMNGNMRLQGRSLSVNGEYLDKLDHVPHLMDFFNSLPNGTCLLGEIYFPDNEGSNKVTTIMGCLTEKAIERQNKGVKLHYYIFDMWAWDGKSLMKTVAADRFEMLHNLKNTEYVEVAHYSDGNELWVNLQNILAAGGEGVVITKKDSIPAPGKRTARKTLKIKKELQDTVDCFFTGHASAPTKLYTGKSIETWIYWENEITGEKLNGEYYKDYAAGMAIIPVTKPYFNGWAGSLEIGVSDSKNMKVVPIGYLSGLSDEIKAKWQEYYGRCNEIDAMQRHQETGGLRHAKFIRFRDDLTVADCTLEKFNEQT